MHVPELNFYFINKFPEEGTKLLKQNTDSEERPYYLSTEYNNILSSIVNEFKSNKNNPGIEVNDSLINKFYKALTNLNSELCSSNQEKDPKILLIYAYILILNKSCLFFINSL